MGGQHAAPDQVAVRGGPCLRGTCALCGARGLQPPPGAAQDAGGHPRQACARIRRRAGPLRPLVPVHELPMPASSAWLSLPSSRLRACAPAPPISAQLQLLCHTWACAGPGPSLTRARHWWAQVCAHFRPCLHHFFLEEWRSPAAWFEHRLRYTRSTATNSMTGYIIGLGDRHLNNILVNRRRATASGAGMVAVTVIGSSERPLRAAGSRGCRCAVHIQAELHARVPGQCGSAAPRPAGVALEGPPQGGDQAAAQQPLCGLGGLTHGTRAQDGRGGPHRPGHRL